MEVERHRHARDVEEDEARVVARNTPVRQRAGREQQDGDPTFMSLYERKSVLNALGGMTLPLYGEDKVVILWV